MGGRSLAALTLAAVFAASAPGVAPAQEAEPGGTLRIGVTRFEFSANFDPTAEYMTMSWSLFTNLLLRTLVTYRHVRGSEGTELVPDLATEVPQPSDDGLMYTFHLKDGIRFGPPVNREITSEDVEYAFARIHCMRCFAQYGFYYEQAIDGMGIRNRTRRPQLGSIRGIETPDDKTIVFHLKKPTGDFLHRLTLPATAPIPREMGRCEYDLGMYGDNVVSSGPYMIAGSEDFDVTADCEEMEGESFSGYRIDRRITFVRNPNYDPATDSREVRENFVDRVVLRQVDGSYNLFDQVRRGELDLALQDPPQEVIGRYERDPELQDRLHADAADRTWYITMNLTRPPFDDIEVRRAVNLALDKEEVREAWGGPTAGEVATHILPPTMTGDHPTSEEYDPYPDANEEAARAAMARSRYDTDGDGRCDKPICNEVVMTTRGRCRDDPTFRFCRQWAAAEPAVDRALDAIGIDVEFDRKGNFNGYTSLMNVRRAVRISMVPGWAKDYPDPCTYMCWLFDGRRIECDGNLNYSLVGATEQTKQECHAPGRFVGLPSVDADIDRCQAMPVGQERTECWVGLDRKLMEEVVPWVPYLWATNIRIAGPAVTKYEFDQFTAEPALAHIAVDPAQQR